jgi:excisionase family DNA binding protein
MAEYERDWLSLAEASERLGIHPTTLRRWADAGSIPHLRTPGGHRRFRSADLTAWMRGKNSNALAPRSEALMHSALGLTRQIMAEQSVSAESWYLAFAREDRRQQMRDTGRQLFALAIQYMSRRDDHEPLLQEGRRIGEFYGQQCAEQDVALVDTVRALFFFRDSLSQAISPEQATPGHYDAEDVRIHHRLRRFLDQVMYGCLASYEAACRHRRAGA